MAYYPFATELGARYVLVAPDGTTAVFNDPADANYVGMVTDVTGLDSADVRESASELVEADGGTHGAFYLGRRPINLAARIFGHASVAQRNVRLDLARRACNALRADATLSWKPSKRVENFVTNPRAVNDTSGWLSSTSIFTNSGGTLTRVTGVTPAVGTTAFQLATTGSGSASQGARTSLFGVQAGVPITFSISARRTAGTGTLRIMLGQDSSGANVTGVVSLVPTGSFVTYTYTMTPTWSGQSTFVVRSEDSGSLASTFQFSDVLVSPQSTYVDGDTAGYYWQGDAHASASGDFVEMFTPVRRQQPFRESGAWVKDIQIPLVSAAAFLYSTGLKTVASGVASENRGSSPAYPLINITGPSTNPIVSDGSRQLMTTGLTAGADIASGETLQVDTLNHTAKFTAGTRNGQSGNRYLDYANSRWPYFSAAASTTMTLSGGGTATMQYRDTWV